MIVYLLIAEHDEQLIGFLLGNRGEMKRNKYSLRLVIVILQAFTERGIGPQLFHCDGPAKERSPA